MSYSKNLVLGAALGLTLGLPAFAQETPEANEAAEADVNTVVATVNGEDITLGHMIVMRETLSDQNKALPDEVIFEGLLERLIQQRAVAQAVEELSLEAELSLENERNALIASRKVAELAAGIEVSDEDLQAAYDAKYADFQPQDEFNASHILVETREEAEAVIEELEGGADFAELAKDKSTGPSGPNGGSLGWFSAGMMVKPFEDAVLALEAGDVSEEPVETQFGWHVIKLNETRTPEAPTLEEERPALESAVWEEKLRAEIAAVVEEAEVARPDTADIDPAVLKNLSLIAE
jgi:peptidyl-prolyl cis-trans isomerase C